MDEPERLVLDPELVAELLPRELEPLFIVPCEREEVPSEARPRTLPLLPFVAAPPTGVLPMV